MQFTGALVSLIILLFASGIVAAFQVAERASVTYAAGAVLALSSAGLLLLRKPAARYPFFALAALIAAWSIHTISRAAQQDWPYLLVLQGLVVLVLCVVASAYVRGVCKTSGA